MKLDDLEAFLNHELSWRKQEIASLNLIAFKTHNDSNKDQILYQTIMKTLFLLLYSHWEGCIKKTSKLYLKYLSNQNIITASMTNNFSALVLQRSIDLCSDEKSLQSLNITNYLNFINLHENKLTKKFKIDIKIDQDLDDGFIQTHSNLTYKNFKNIIKSLNLPFYNYYFSEETKVDVLDINQEIQTIEYLKNILDFNLVAHRNAIAHGSTTVSLDYDDYLKLEEKTLFLLSIHVEDIIEFCYNEFYLKEKNIALLNYIESQNNKVNSFFNNIDRELSSADLDDITV